MAITTEQETIMQAATGHQQAFRTLVETHQGLVYSIAFRFVRDEIEAEDLTQETFIRLWKNLEHYNPEFKLKTWLGKIVTNLSLDHLKSARKKNEKQRVKLNEELNIQSHQNPERELNETEIHQLVLRLSDQLPDKQKSAFMLRDLEQLDVNEVCEILEISAGTLKSNLYYARLHMKEALTKYLKV